MKLHAVDPARLMLDRHHRAVGVAGGHAEEYRQRPLLDDERVVSAAGERAGQSREQAPAIVMHEARPPVHGLLRPHHPAAEGRRDRLMTEADAQDRMIAAEVPDDVDRAARLGWRAGPGRDDDSAGRKLADLPHGRTVGRHDLHVRAEPREISPEVVDEAVAIVEEHDHGITPAGSAAGEPDATASSTRIRP